MSSHNELLNKYHLASWKGVPQALEDLLSAIGILFQPTQDLTLEGIEFTGAFGDFGLAIGLAGQPTGNGFDVQSQLPGDLGRAQSVFPMEVVNLTVSGVVDHEGPPG